MLKTKVASALEGLTSQTVQIEEVITMGSVTADGSILSCLSDADLDKCQ